MIHTVQLHLTGIGELIEDTIEVLQNDLYLLK